MQFGSMQHASEIWSISLWKKIMPIASISLYMPLDILQYSITYHDCELEF